MERILNMSENSLLNVSKISVGSFSYSPSPNISLKQIDSSLGSELINLQHRKNAKTKITKNSTTDYETVFPAEAQSLASSSCSENSELYFGSSKNNLFSSSGAALPCQKSEISELDDSYSETPYSGNQKTKIPFQRHLRLESMTTTHDSEGNRELQEHSNTTISIVSPKKCLDARKSKTTITSGTADAKTESSTENQVEGQGESQTEIQSVSQTDNPTKPQFSKHKTVTNGNHQENCCCRNCNNGFGSDSINEEPEQIIVTPKIYSRSTSPLPSEDDNTSDKNEEYSRIRPTPSEGDVSNIHPSSYSMASKVSSEPTCEFISQFLQVAGRNFDDNPKLWSKLRIFLQEQQALLHQRTRELEASKRKTRSLEDELGSAMQKLRKAENQRDNSVSVNFPPSLSAESPMIVRNTSASASSKIDTVNCWKQDYQEKLDKKNDECLNLIHQLEDARNRLNQSELRCSELETETNFIAKERDLWKLKTSKFKESERILEEEVNRLRRALTEVHKTVESTYGETLCKLRKTITKQQNQLSMLEEAVQKQSQLHDYQDLLDSKKELESQIVEQQAEIAQLEKISSVYQQEQSRLEQIDDRAEFLERELEEKKEALRQLQDTLQYTEDEKARLEEALDYVNMSLEKEVSSRDEKIENYEGVIESLKYQLQKGHESLNSKHLDCITLEEEVDELRKECRKLQKLLREQTSSALAEIENLNTKLQTADDERRKEIIGEVEKRQERFKEEMDSMIELRTNQRVEAIRSKYENKIARLKHHLIHKHSNHVHNKLDLKKLIASEIAKYTTSSSDSWGDVLQMAGTRQEKAIGSATASSWQPAIVNKTGSSDGILEVN